MNGKYNNKILKILQELYEYHTIMKKNKQSIYRAASYKKIIKEINKTPINNIDYIIKIKHIGKNTIKKIEEIIKTGTLKMYEEIKKNKNYKHYKNIESILGFGPIKAQYIINKGIYSINNIKKHPDIKLTKIQKIGLKYYKDLNKTINNKQMDIYIEKITKLLYPIKILIAGSYYRGEKQCRDIDIICIKENITINTIIEKLKDIIIEVINKGNIRTMLLIKYNDKYVRKIDIALVPLNEINYYTLYFRYGKEFLKELREKAHKKGYKLNEKGLFKNGMKIHIKHNGSENENDILHFINEL